VFLCTSFVVYLVFGVCLVCNLVSAALRGE